MTLFVHRAERADRLAVGLADLLADPLPDVFAEEIVAVPAGASNGGWPNSCPHRLGRRDGQRRRDLRRRPVPAPGRGGRDRHRHRTARPVVTRQPGLAAAGGHRRVDRPGLVPHAVHPPRPRMSAAEEQYRRGRRYAVARRLAGLFDGYATNRPAMLRPGRRVSTTDGLGRACRPTCAGSASCGAGCATASTAPDPGAVDCAMPSPPCASDRPTVDLPRTPFAVRADPAAGQPAQPCWPRSPRRGTSICGSPTRHHDCGHTGREAPAGDAAPAAAGSDRRGARTLPAVLARAGTPGSCS